jgi:hypothetical protein
MDDSAFAVSRDREETIESNGRTISVIPAFKFMLKRANTIKV